MINASITTITYDIDGAVILKIDPSQSDLRTATRRLSRSATLDGGVVITDSGFAHGDRTIKLTAVDVSEEDETNLVRIFQTYSQVSLALPEGVFLGHLESVTPVFGRIDISFMVEGKTSV